MIIQCENCKAKFRLDDSKIPAQGRKVRCSKCKNVFFVSKESSQKLEPEEAGAQRARVSAPEAEEAFKEEFPEEPAFEPTVRIDISAEADGPAVRPHEPPAAAVQASSRGRRWVRPVAVALGAVLAVGMIVVILTKLGYIPSLWEEKQDSPVSKLTVDQGQLTGRWERNAQIPRIFVVNGTVRNQSNKPVSFVKVRGLLLDKSGKVVREAWAFCGNTIPLEDLRTKAPSEIQELMGNREGKAGANRRLVPGGMIPFTLVFFEVPEGVEAFGVEVVEAQSSVS